MKVINMESVKGSGRPVANQFIIAGENTKTFQSYDSTIAEYNYGTRTLKVFDDWDYGNTTRTYFKKFVNEETPFTYEDRQKWIKEMETNNRIVKA